MSLATLTSLVLYEKDSLNAIRVKRLSGAPLLGRYVASPTHIKIGWKGLTGTNTNILETFINYICEKSDNIGT